MSMREVALSLHHFDKQVATLEEGSLKHDLKNHIEQMLQRMLNDQVMANEVRNFQLSEPTPKTKKNKA